MQEFVAAGFKGAVWRVTDEDGRERALKLTMYEDYQDRPYLDEVYLSTDLEQCESFARAYDHDLISLAFPDGEKKFVVFLEEWIPGLTLEKFLYVHPELATPAFLVAYVRAMCQALNDLETRNLIHDDLHARNVMLMEPSASSLTQEWRVKVVDLGSLKRPPTRKSKSDHLNLVDHIILVWNAIHARRPLPTRDIRFLGETEKLVREMLDQDLDRQLKNPGQIARQFQLALTRSLAPRNDEPQRLNDPFEFIAAEHIADDQLLVEIFAESCPWLDEVNGREPCLVTGPRGCGKSTIFRWLSLKAHIHKTDLSFLNVSGFYLSCSSDLANRIGWIKTDEEAERLRPLIIHYFNLLAAREVLNTLELILQDPAKAESDWGLGGAQQGRISDFILDRLSLSGRPRLQGVSRIQQALDALETEMFSAHQRMIDFVDAGRTTHETFLGDLSTLLVRECPIFATRPIAFLVDDYSTHRLPGPVQKILNRIIWERRSSHIFKLSSETLGMIPVDSTGATIEDAREMREIDCGREYLNLADIQSTAFATELLNNRLKAAAYAGTAETLIGPSQWDEGVLGRALALRKPGRTDDQYHGLTTISELCSGDVSNLLLIFRRIFERGRVDEFTTSTVPKHVQHQAIVEVSRQQFESIKHHHPHGLEMYRIVSEFGRLVARILHEGRWQSQGETTVPPQCPRIEIDQKTDAKDEYSSADLELQDQLLKRAIFIEMLPGRSRHERRQTLRWNLRRIYLPVFGAATSKNTSVMRNETWFREFLRSPALACDIVWRAYPKRSAKSPASTIPFPFEPDDGR